MTLVAGSHSLFAPVIQKFVAFGNEIGLDGQRLFADMTQGHANATFESNAVLWEIAAAADRSPAVRATLLETDPAGAWDAIRALSGAQEFVVAFEAYLERYGCRAGSWGLGYPTWQEDPASPLRLVRRILEERPEPPEQALREGARRREAVIRGVEERLGNDAVRVARFRKLAEPLAYYIPIREARAYWQLVLTGVMRALLLARGRSLVQRGVLDQPDDVFYLMPEEIESAVNGNAADVSSRIEERKTEWEFWSRRCPPEFIGGGGDTESRRVGDVRAEVIRGVAASRGLVTARARVIADIGDADRLQPGEVLVCAMSSPPWTPLFAIAAAVVTDSGGILSHPAIVAREYGIPCVVGTRVGTQAIRDGDVITVDGEQGTVRIEVGA
jgi:pyruvate,water dikinase